MLKKRLTGVITVRDGWAVQSFGYHRYLPIGRPECVVENLDRWGIDEILLQVIDRSNEGSKLGSDLNLLRRISKMGIGSPLVYGGGIESVEDALRVVEAGADRILLDSLLVDKPETVVQISHSLGAQAVIGSIPASFRGDVMERFDHRSRTATPFSGDLLQLLGSGLVSEALVIDHVHEGTHASFDQRLVSCFPVPALPLIAFGGISTTDQMIALLGSKAVSAVAVGNFLSYREHAVQRFKEGLTQMPVRPATFESRYPLVYPHAKD
jgi:imidazole glycerol-phosphate synthase subunit HisF